MKWLSGGAKQRDRQPAAGPQVSWLSAAAMFWMDRGGGVQTGYTTVEQLELEPSDASSEAEVRDEVGSEEEVAAGPSEWEAYGRSVGVVVRADAAQERDGVGRGERAED
jgi:hypothetical protein